MFHATWARGSLCVCLAAAVACATSSTITAAEQPKRGPLSAVGGAFGRAIGILPEMKWKEPPTPPVTKEASARAEATYEQFNKLYDEFFNEKGDRSGAALAVPKVRGLNPGRALDRFQGQGIAPNPPPVFAKGPTAAIVGLPVQVMPAPPLLERNADATVAMPAVRGLHPGQALDHLVVRAVAPSTEMYSRKSFIAGGPELPPEFRALARKVDERAADLEDEGEYVEADRLREMARMFREMGREAEQVVTKPPVPKFYSAP